MLHKNIVVERALRAVIVAAFFALPAVSQPIQIGSYADLCKIGVDNAYPLNGTYELIADIDASASRAQDSGFKPIGIGYSGISFTGTFDGKGHTISGLYIKRDSSFFVGLFGFVDSGTISRVIIAADSVIGKSHVGALVGYARNSVIRGCVLSSGVVIGNVSNAGGLVGVAALNIDITDCSTGKPVIVIGNEYVGGLIGISTNGSTVTNSHFTGSMVRGIRYVGGLIGENRGTVTGCSYEIPGDFGVPSYKGGYVSGAATQIGGLVGYNNMSGTIVRCHAKTTVSGISTIGGLVGYNEGTVTNSYHEASFAVFDDGKRVMPKDTVRATYITGGLIGINSGTVTKCYSASFVLGYTISAVGGLIGRNDSTGTVSECYSASSGIVSVGGSPSGGAGTGGLVGANSGTVTRCYSLSSASGGDTLGGLVGKNNTTGNISECYSAGVVTGGSTGTSIGGLVGFADNPNKVTNSFWDTQTSGQTVSAGGQGYGTSLMANEFLYTSANWDFKTVWELTSSYPRFKYQPAPASVFRTGPSRRGGASLVPVVSVRGKSLSVSADPDSRVRVRLVNMSGRTVANFVSFGSASHSLRGLPAGAYIAEVRRGAYRSAASVVVK